MKKDYIYDFRFSTWLIIDTVIEFLDVIHLPVLNKTRMIDNIQNVNNFINIQSSQTFTSYFIIHAIVLLGFYISACRDVTEVSEVHGASIFGVEVSILKIEASIILLLLDLNSRNREHGHYYLDRWDAVRFSRGLRFRVSMVCQPPKYTALHPIARPPPTQNNTKNNANIHDLRGIRTHDLSVRAGQFHRLCCIRVT
jgi:hypothetical protein